MAKYLFRASYTQTGITGVLKEGAASRLTAITKVAKSVGGKIESCYWAFGEDDIVIIADLPDHAAAIAISSGVGASGAARVSTTVLLTAAEVDAGRKLTPQYRAPGA
jgi:uncharacterized protein with GYD domain